MMMKKGFAAMCLVMVLAMGTVAGANSRQAAQSTAATTTQAALKTGAPDQMVRPASDLAQSGQTAPDPAGPSAQAQPADAASAPAAPADRRAAGPTLSITDLAYDVADEKEARVNVAASGVLRNTSKTPINLRDVKVLLQDAEGKVAIPARIEAVNGKEMLGRGEAAEVRLTFAGVPTDARALQMTLATPAGGTVINAITITITCTYPPLRCRIDISW